MSFKVQRQLINDFGASEDTKNYTLTETLGNVNSAFILPGWHRGAKGAGPIADPGGTDWLNRDLAIWLELTSTTNVKATRRSDAPNEDVRLPFEVIEYTGAASGANEFIVRSRTTISMTSGNASATSGAISAISNYQDCIVIITGVDDPYAFNRPTVVTATVNSDKTITFVRSSTAVTSTVYYTVVEFTGSNWSVQQIDQNVASTGVNTITITDVSNWSNAFVIGAIRPAGNHAFDAVNYGGQVYSGSITTQMRYYLDADATGTVTDYRVVCWVVKNSEISVQHHGSLPAGDGLIAYTSFQEDKTITAVSSMAATMIVGQAESQDNASNPPVEHWTTELTSTTNVRYWRARDGGSGVNANWALQVVELPAGQDLVKIRNETVQV